MEEDILNYLPTVMFRRTHCMFFMSSFTFPRILFKKLHLADLFRSFLFTQHFANACLSLADIRESSSHWLKFINLAGRRTLLQGYTSPHSSPPHLRWILDLGNIFSSSNLLILWEKMCETATVFDCMFFL